MAARRYGLGPLFDLHSYAKTIPKSLDAPPSPLYTLQPCVARGSLAPLANLATVRLPHRARPQALPRAYPAQYDRRDGVSSKRNLIHTAKCSVSSRAVRA